MAAVRLADERLDYPLILLLRVLPPLVHSMGRSGTGMRRHLPAVRAELLAVLLGYPVRDMRHACKQRPPCCDLDTVRATALIVYGAHAACSKLIACLPDRSHVVRSSGHDLHVRGIHLPAVHIRHGQVIHAPQEVMIGEAHRVCEVLAFPGGFLDLRRYQLLQLLILLQRDSRAIISAEHFPVELVRLRRSLPNNSVDLCSGTAVDLGNFRGDLVRGKPQGTRPVISAPFAMRRAMSRRINSESCSYRSVRSCGRFWSCSGVSI